MTDRDRARHIRAVAVVNAAEVHRHEIARLDGLFTRYAMRLGAVRARNDDRVKRHVLRAIVQHEVGQPCRDLLLGHADLDVVQYLLERLLRDALCRDDLLNLVLFLAHAQLLHTVLETDSCRVQCRAPRHELRIGKRFVLESDLFRAVLVKQLIDKRRIALPRLDLAHLKILDGRVCRFDITEIREEYRLFSRQVHRACRRVKARSVAAADLAGQHQRIIRLLEQHGTQFVSFHGNRLLNISR